DVQLDVAALFVAVAEELVARAERRRHRQLEIDARLQRADATTRRTARDIVGTWHDFDLNAGSTRAWSEHRGCGSLRVDVRRAVERAADLERGHRAIREARAVGRDEVVLGLHGEATVAARILDEVVRRGPQMDRRFEAGEADADARADIEVRQDAIA